MRSAIAVIAMLWIDSGLSTACAGTSNLPMQNWDASAPVVVAELAQIASTSDAQRDVWQKRGEWLLGTMGQKSGETLSPMAEAEKFYLAEYHDKTPGELAAVLNVALPANVTHWAMPMSSLRNSSAFIQPLQDCMADGDAIQGAVCHLLLIDVVTAQYQPKDELKKVAYPELLEGNHYLQTIIDIATIMANEEYDLEGGSGFDNESSDLPLNVAVAKASMLAAGSRLLKLLR